MLYLSLNLVNFSFEFFRGEGGELINYMTQKADTWYAAESLCMGTSSKRVMFGWGSKSRKITGGYS